MIDDAKGLIGCAPKLPNQNEGMPNIFLANVL
jgi:hypothetical protein